MPHLILISSVFTFFVVGQFEGNPPGSRGLIDEVREPASVGGIPDRCGAGISAYFFFADSRGRRLANHRQPRRSR